MDDYGPYDPTLEYSAEPAIKELSPEGADIPAWKPLNMTRRSFLRGVVCSGIVIAGSAYIFSHPTKAKADARAVERLVTLNVNGRKRQVETAPNETLAYTLRYRLGLTGTKIGCNRAECGACTVMADGTTLYSCSTLTQRVRDKDIVTVEGVGGADGALHPVQQAFIDEIGPQCGFCTPGQVVSAVALLNKNSNPTIEQARLAMSGNLCRCGAYDHYLRGVMKAAGRA
jgi:aerobic-type carbon monoxide dehydrogenase small subunit (CoxS/CutS family)